MKKINRLKIKSRYKHNYNTGKLIYLKKNDKKLGCSKLLIKDSIDTGYPILVPTSTHSLMIKEQLFNMLGIQKNITVTPANKGLNYEYILVDNSCTEFDVTSFLQTNSRTKIYNGFITSRYM